MANTKEDPVVDTITGKIRGSVDRSCEGDYFYSFKGIPYAKPSVGQLRFKDPEPIEPWSGIRDAKKFGLPSAQLEWVSQTFIGSDDCLYLNVYTKNLKPSKKQPVMVWIHGGYFMVGEGSDKMFGPDYFMRKDIILVTFNYRLGIFGFLNLEDEISPGNYGLKDQVILLKWVRNNIANFGGDPNNVTIFGASAGSASVHYQTLSPLSKGLFHKAIMQSGVVLNPWAVSEDPKYRIYKLCEILGNNTRDHEKIVSFLQKIERKKLIEAVDQILPPKHNLKKIPFGPGVDLKSKNPFMPIHPDEAAMQGIHVPLIIGHNSQENLMLVNPKLTVEKLDKNFSKRLHLRALKKIRSNFDLSLEDYKRLHIKGQITEKDREKVIDLYSELTYVLGIHQIIKIQAERSTAPTYFYKYSYDKTQSPLKKSLGITSPRAGHTDELQHLFRSHRFEKRLSTEPHKKESASYTMMEKMIELWVNFATTGRPTPAPTDLIPLYWQPVNNGTTLRYLNIDEDLRMDVTLNLEKRLIAQKLSKHKL